jgi:hypothetical protein
MQTVFLGIARGKQTMKVLFLTVTKTSGQGGQDWVGQVILQELPRNVKQNRNVARKVAQFSITQLIRHSGTAVAA